MLSDLTSAEIERLTDQALEEIQGPQAIDRVTAIRGYVRMASNHPALYHEKLIMAVQELADVAKAQWKVDLGKSLEKLVAKIDQECG